MATINNAITGTSQLFKIDLGTLILNGVNSYTGGTAINGGTHQIAADTALDTASRDVSFINGTRSSVNDITSARNAFDWQWQFLA